MLQRHLTPQTWHIGLFGLALLLAARPGAGEGEKPKAKGNRVCASAWTNGQQLEQAGRLRQAKEVLLGCSKASCGATRARCSARLAHIDADIPSVVPLVTDEAGEPRTE